jgi:hypothetical protein
MVVGYTTSLVSLDIPANIAFLERTCCLLKIPTTRALYKPALLMHNTTLEICPLTLGSGLDLMSVWLQGKSQFNFFQIQLTILARGFCISLSLPDIGYVSPRNRNHQFMAPPPIPSICAKMSCLIAPRLRNWSCFSRFFDWSRSRYDTGLRTVWSGKNLIIA